MPQGFAHLCQLTQVKRKAEIFFPQKSRFHKFRPMLQDEISDAKETETLVDEEIAYQYETFAETFAEPVVLLNLQTELGDNNFISMTPVPCSTLFFNDQQPEDASEQETTSVKCNPADWTRFDKHF